MKSTLSANSRKNISNLLNGKGEVDTTTEDIKTRFLASLKALKEGYTTLSKIVQEHIDNRGAEADGQAEAIDDLVVWAVEAGYSQSYIRNTISKLLRDSGVIRRKSGAGAKVPQQATDLAQYAITTYGADAKKFLLAAYRAADKVSTNKATAKIASVVETFAKAA